MSISSKAAILQKLRRNPPAGTELPDLNHDWVRFDDPRRQFVDVLESVGGRAVAAADLAEVNTALAGLPAFQAATKIASLVEGIHGATVDLAELQDPHQAEDVDFLVAPGVFAVAENGAVWVTGERLAHRVAYFIVQHLALVVPADALVHNLHQAYGRIRFDQPGFGLFISGPSKTADIEQALVIGAHGPRSLTVFLVG